MGDHLPHPARHVDRADRGPPGGHQTGQLAHEQRVAAGSSHHVGHTVGREATVGHSIGKIGGLLVGEPSEGDHLDAARQPDERRRGVDVTEAPDDQHRERGT